MKNIILIFLTALLLSSCQSSCEKYIGKRKDCYLIKERVIRDTTFIPEFRHDSVFITRTNDTILIEKDRVRLQIIRRTDTLETFLTIPADTIIKEIKVPEIVPVYHINFNWWHFVPSILLIFCAILFYYFKPRR